MKPIFLILGFISFGLGSIGIFLPLLPSTPLYILAAYFFSKSSPKMHQKVLNLPIVGELVKEWNEHKVINPKAKILSVIMIVLLMGISIYFKRSNLLVIILLTVIGVSVISFIVTRKSYRV